MDFIFIHGAPGVGKSSLAWALQAKYQSPCFEFGWIPEFRVKQNSTITYEEEEGIAFENLTLVLKNYVRHGFGNIVVTDLRDPIIRQLSRRFYRYQYLLITLWMENEELLKSRVLDESRSSGFRDWEYALALNQEIIHRPLMRNEIRLNNDRKSIEELVDEITTLVTP